MTIAIILLVLALPVYVCRHRIKKAIKRQVRKAEDKAAELVIRGLKGAAIGSARVAGKGYRALVKLA